jgi:hypothetical protein
MGNEPGRRPRRPPITQPESLPDTDLPGCEAAGDVDGMHGRIARKGLIAWDAASLNVPGHRVGNAHPICTHVPACRAKEADIRTSDPDAIPIISARRMSGSPPCCCDIPFPCSPCPLRASHGGLRGRPAFRRYWRNRPFRRAMGDGLRAKS